MTLSNSLVLASFGFNLLNDLCDQNCQKAANDAPDSSIKNLFIALGVISALACCCIAGYAYRARFFNRPQNEREIPLVLNDAAMQV